MYELMQKGREMQNRMQSKVKVAEMKKRPYYQSKVMRGLGRLEDQGKSDNKRKAYRDDVRLEIERAQLVYESYQQT
ncbi:MAG: hypothetical protein GX660_22750, partial [Clostridiaceae bacterium]|nr:hypothetical protein [Clostridiaceae bacterium]